MVTTVLSLTTLLGFTLGMALDRCFRREVNMVFFMVGKGWKQFKLDMKDFAKWLFKVINGLRKLAIFPFLAMKLGAGQASKQLNKKEA